MEPVSSNGLDELKLAWGNVVEARAVDPNPQVLIGGINLRLNVAAALKTVYVTAKICFKTKKATFTLDPWTVLEIGRDTYELVNAALNALIQRLNPSVYTLAIVLAGHDKPVSSAELRMSLGDFLNGDVDTVAPWHLHITRRHLEETRRSLQEPQGFDKLLAALKKQGLAEQQDNRAWAFTPRHWTWTSTME
jgi:hypothetical protein